ncbi:MAG TPA: cysteine-rich CWC family protein [Trinickia sp.]|uniref:cysteine-rich CWC family protein n=1 Tax=Trinickia sp. TaxID=2571163 RepID=UPI002BC1B2F0|nr:cysteine-rich CWC family protein [Trinickia sp.]HTI18536.1 cysteine-rich CWC family protein [Trinickia sp.]
MCPSNPVEADAAPARCPRCGEAFDCGHESSGCWCSSQRLLGAERIVPGMSCLCPKCLAAALAASSRPPAQ